MTLGGASEALATGRTGGRISKKSLVASQHTSGERTAKEPGRRFGLLFRTPRNRLLVGTSLLVLAGSIAAPHLPPLLPGSAPVTPPPAEVAFLVTADRIAPGGARLGKQLPYTTLLGRLNQWSDVPEKLQTSSALQAEKPTVVTPALHVSLLDLIDWSDQKSIETSTQQLKQALTSMPFDQVHLYIGNPLLVPETHPLAQPANLQLDDKKQPIRPASGYVMLDFAAPEVKDHVAQRVGDAARLARDINAQERRIRGISLVSPGYPRAGSHGKVFEEWRGWRFWLKTPPDPQRNGAEWQKWAAHQQQTSVDMLNQVARTIRSEDRSLRVIALFPPRESELTGLGAPGLSSAVERVALVPDGDPAKVAVTRAIEPQAGIAATYNPQTLARLFEVLGSNGVGRVLLFPAENPRQAPPAGNPATQKPQPKASPTPKTSPTQSPAK
jgi:hypothetical protein